ncbi:MAG: arginine deiminase-related protein [Cyclobacteriaceae bacterium]
MTKQITNTVMMVRPASFHMNEQTAVNNFYQQKEDGRAVDEIQQRALLEFDAFVDSLKSNGIEVLVFQDRAEDDTPDSIFPNNWNSFHEDGTVYLYPMYAENRRSEVKPDILHKIKSKFEVGEIHSFRHWEKENKFLEGTGSLILDRPNKLAYAAVSDRTQMPVLEEFSEKSGFELVTFHAFQTVHQERLPIYHTNVMMCVGEKFSVVCLDSIDDYSERNQLIKKLENTGKEIIAISEDQCNQFAGNMLQVMNKNGEKFVVLSHTAYSSLSDEQLKRLTVHGTLIHPDLSTIEKYGGGSARCMLAEIFLQPKYKL